MPLRDLSIPFDAPDSRCHVCVVGAGLAGYAISAPLSAKGYRVIVLESGDRAGSDRVSSTLNRVDNPFDRYSRAETNRSRGLGGTSRLWGGRMIPISSFETRPRPYLSEPGWPIDVEELDLFDREVENLFKVNSAD